jgi:hypothetical protein
MQPKLYPQLCYRKCMPVDRAVSDAGHRVRHVVVTGCRVVNRVFATRDVRRSSEASWFTSRGLSGFRRVRRLVGNAALSKDLLAPLAGVTVTRHLADVVAFEQVGKFLGRALRIERRRDFTHHVDQRHFLFAVTNCQGHGVRRAACLYPSVNRMVAGSNPARGAN